MTNTHTYTRTHTPYPSFSFSCGLAFSMVTEVVSLQPAFVEQGSNQAQHAYTLTHTRTVSSSDHAHTLVHATHIQSHTGLLLTPTHQHVTPASPSIIVTHTHTLQENNSIRNNTVSQSTGRNGLGSSQQELESFY